jgi:hypothetical protein
MIVNLLLVTIIIQGVPFKTTTHGPLHAQNDERNGNVEFLQLYPVVAADAVLEIGPVVIADILSLDEHLSQIKTSCVPKFFLQVGVLFALFGTFLSEYALLNASRTAKNDFGVK